ncbi:AraC family transcriptional regulator [Bordetella petrii]|uniref:AraC family transcriptional regulator n=1 Tax=Bordetella petrii TaxID=94624 RepID=UPI001E469B38|nr:AraC family transcriptional regulator [Bordetella petrii]MCD0502510.1 AraC family transcriptional regulator [Bordetella petrii]
MPAAFDSHGPIAEHTVAITQVEQIIQGARKLGLDIPAVLWRAGISPALLEAPRSRVTQAQYAQLMRVLARLTHDELWGLTPHPVRPGSFVQICSQLIHYRTLGEAIRTGLGLYRPLLRAFTPRLVVLEGVARIQVDHHGGHVDTLESYAMRSFCFLSYGVMSWLTARRIPVLCVGVPSARGYRSEAERLMHTRVRNTGKRASLEFEAHWLDLPVVQTPESLQTFIREVPGNLVIKYRDRSRLTERIRRLLRQRAMVEGATLVEVSQHLGMTPQTVRRHLKAEGQSFQGIKDDLRRDAAIQLLARPHLTLNDVAARLGFSEASTFHRAFKSWTGLAPGMYRETNLKPAVPH